MTARSTFDSANDYWIVRAKFETIESMRSGHRNEQPIYVTEDETRELLDGDPRVAEARAREGLKADAGDLQARFLLGAALRAQHQDEAARAVLEPLVVLLPQMGSAWRELGFALEALGKRYRATEALLQAIDFDCLDKNAWYGLGNLLEFPATDSDSRQRNATLFNPRIAQAADAIRNGEFERAERALREALEVSPEHDFALQLLAEVLILGKRWPEAKVLLEQCVALAPGSIRARFRFATMLLVHRHYLLALPHIEELLKSDPANRLYRTLKAAGLSRSRQFGLAIVEYEAILKDYPSLPGLWLDYARVLRIEQRENALDAFRRAIQILPSFVQAYLALAYVKTSKLDRAIVDLVRVQLKRPEIPHEDQARLHYVLGKAFEDMERYADSFEHYRLSNEILCRGRKFGSEISTDFKRRTKRFFKPQFFREHAGVGCTAADPIFIVGMPRAGSTLVEQILASHSAIEGLGELADMGDILERLADEARERGMSHPSALRDFDPDRFRSLGEEYIKLTRRRRKTVRPFFTDKMPANFSHVPFIHLLLPNARIIDARRHPLDCCFSCFKHYFPAGQPISTSLRDVGRGYADYIELMAHFDDVLPGRVHRVVYEQLIGDPEREVRRMLEYVGVPFEERCLRFHENDRLVMTISADQVRMPLYKSGVEQWRPYEQWLGPLKEELGYILNVYPQVPKYYIELRGRYSEPLRFGPGGNRFTLVRGVQQAPFEVPSQRTVLSVI